MYSIGQIDKEIFETYFGKLQTSEVIITEERVSHIKEHHPSDFELFEQYKTECITSPDLIITDERNHGTVYMVKELRKTNLNVILRLALATDREGLKNSVMTFWRIREKNVEKLAKKNHIIYKKE